MDWVSLSFSTYFYGSICDIIELVDINGTSVVKYKYDAWGNIISQTGGSLTDVNPYRYRGYRYDVETGLYYLQSRYYDPSIGRFISTDGLLGEIGNISTHNTYAYCGNNPIMHVDHSGDAFLTILIVSIIVAAVITTGAAITYGSITDTPVVLDVSISLPINAGTNVKFGVSFLFDFEANNVQFYGHSGASTGVSSGITYSVGLVDNYENEGDYSGPFVFYGAGNFIGFDHCFDPNSKKSEAIQASSITFGWKGSGYIGIDEYSYWGKHSWGKPSWGFGN